MITLRSGSTYMNLFNEYANKNILLIQNFINYSILETYLSSEELNSLLLDGKRALTFPELVYSILNEDEKYSLNLLAKDKCNNVASLITINGHMPLLLTKAERIWLKGILSSPLSDLFINPFMKAELLSSLKDEPDLFDNPYVEIREFYKNNGLEYKRTAELFKSITNRIKHLESATIVFKNSTEIEVYPYRIIYSQLHNTFTLFAYHIENSDIIHIPFDDINYIENSSYGTYSPHEYNDSTLDDVIDKALTAHTKNEPIILEVYTSRISSSGKIKNSMAGDRFSYLFTDYSTVNHINCDGNLVSEITYYDFQEEELLQKIMALGKYAKVKSPQDIIDKIVARISKKIQA